MKAMKGSICLTVFLVTISVSSSTVLSQSRPLAAAMTPSLLTSQSAEIGYLGSWDYGPCEYVVMKGDTAIVSNGAYLQIFDCTDKNSPSLLSERLLPRIPNAIAVQGEYVFVTMEWDGMTVFDISDPANPDSIGCFGNESDFAVAEVVPKGDVALVMGLRINFPSYWFGFYSLDISDLTHPEILDSVPAFILDEPEISLSGDYAYVITEDTLGIINMTDPANMTILPSGNLPLDDPEDMVASGDYLYVADEGLIVIDISSPENPTFASSCVSDYMPWSEGVSVSGNYAYVACGYDFAVYDISDPTNCNCINHQAGIHLSCDDLAVIGDYAYIAGEHDGLYILDIQNPISLSLLGLYDMTAETEDIAVSGNYIFTANISEGLGVWDHSPEKHATLGGFYPENITISGNLAYTGYWKTLQVVDISSPLSPVLRGHLDMSGEIMDICVREATAYVACGLQGLRIIDVENPDAISEIGYYNTAGEAKGVALYGRYAVVADGEEGVAIINMANPALPFFEAGLKMYIDARTVELNGDYAYVGSELPGLEAGIVVVDLSNPASPDSVGELITMDETYELEIRANRLYAADFNGLKILDISNPVDPQIIYSYRTKDECKGLALSADTSRIYLACDLGGFAILSNPDATLVQNYSALMENEKIRVEWRLSEEIELSEIALYRRPSSAASYTRLDGSGIHKTGSLYWFLDSDYLPGKDYTYRLARETNDGERVLFEIEFSSSVPRLLTLYQNHPNPFNPSTVIPFYLPERANVSLAVYDVNGRRVATIIDGIRGAGYHNETWYGTDDSGNQLASGIYFCKLVSDKKKETRKIVLLR